MSVVRADDRYVELVGGTDGSWHEAIVADGPVMCAGCRPGAGLRNGHTQMLATLIGDRRARQLEWDREDRLIMDDGGTVSLQWSGLGESADSPVLVVLHTICGSGEALRRFVGVMRRTLGWPVVCCNRRGHGELPLTAPSVNTMGSTSDLRRQIECIEGVRPGASLYAAGISAGSGLLVRYLGEEGTASRFRAAVAVCPAYDLPLGLAAAHPRYDRYMTSKMIRFFLDRHVDVLGEVDGFGYCRSAGSMVEFHERLYPMAGYPSYDAYLGACDPMAVAGDVVTPTLVVNSLDDPVCAATNVERNREALLALPRVTLALTRYGGHVGFFEHAGATETWADAAVAEYLAAADRLFTN